MKAASVAALRLGFCAAAAGARAAGSGYHLLDRFFGPDGGWDHLRVDAAGSFKILVVGR